MKKNINLEYTCQILFTITSLVIASIYSSSCSKERSAVIKDYYNSMEDFHNKNEVAIQHYDIDAASGGSFTTPQGTKVTIPADAFEDQSGNNFSGKIDIEFKDIYRKSDMLLSDIPTGFYGRPLKSAGEFFIRAIAGNELLQIAPGKKIEINQPLNNVPVDTLMLPFIGVVDSAAVNWNLLDSISTLSLTPSLSGYVFSLYEFSAPLSSGTWCNSDNPSYFETYPITTLTLHGADDANIFATDVFLVFKNIKAMIHVYRDMANDFPYIYAPKGLECTAVATGVKDGKLYSAFVPITISDNQTINFTFTEITTDDFKAQLTALDN